MKNFVRTPWIWLCALSAAAVGGGAEAGQWINRVKPEYCITAEQALEWHQAKAAFGPTYAGSSGWLKYMEYLEPRFKAAGLVDASHIDVAYNLYQVNDFPSVAPGVLELISDGTSVPVASYGMTSGFTPPTGLTARMVYYDPATPPADADLAGKIVVFSTVKVPEPPFTNIYMNNYVVPDYLWRNDNDTFPPLWTNVPPSLTTSYHYRWHTSQVAGFATIGMRAKAAGMVIVYDISPEGARGITQRSLYTADGDPHSPYVNCPTLVLDRVAGRKVLTDAKAGKNARLKLQADFVPVVGWQYIGFLPGKDYGTKDDEWIVLGTHTDGMALTQDNGALGILGVINYFKHIPQAERPRTIMVFLECRHFMPGGENKWTEFNYFGPAHHPEHAAKVVSTLDMEHMGELETRETGPGGNTYELSGRVETSTIGLYNNNPWSLRIAAQAVTEHRWPRVSIQSNGPTEPGINGGYMTSARTPMMVGSSLRPKKPGIGFAGNWPGAHTQVYSGLRYFDPKLFRTQVLGMSQIVGELMLVKPVVIDLGWGNLHAMLANLNGDLFVTPVKWANRKAAFFDTYARVFSQVESGDLSSARAGLEALKSELLSEVTPAEAMPLIVVIDEQIAKLQ
jgi:hypothetical protein